MVSVDGARPCNSQGFLSVSGTKLGASVDPTQGSVANRTALDDDG